MIGIIWILTCTLLILTTGWMYESIVKKEKVNPWAIVLNGLCVILLIALSRYIY